LFLTVSATAIVSAQSPPKQLTKEEEQKKKEELRKKVNETLEAAVSDQAATPE
jgi:predicted Holliday junction resolvase-like endonuclease